MTSPTLIAVLLAFSAVSVATALGWGLSRLMSPLASLARAFSPSTRATLHAYLRTLPLAMVVLLVPTQIVVFLRHESGRSETAGPVLFVTAALGFALTIDAAVRAGRALYGTRRAVDTWRRSAAPISLSWWRRHAWQLDSPSPVAVVAGVFQPELFIASQVVEHCSEEELQAIVAHEAAHVRARDNVVRWLFELTPGASWCSSHATALEEAWEIASEEAADAAASRVTSPLAMAAALVKVAQLAVAPPSQRLIAHALIGGNPLDARVRRLLEPVTGGDRALPRWLPAIVLVAATMALQSDPASATVHEAFELLVRHH